MVDFDGSQKEKRSNILTQGPDYIRMIAQSVQCGELKKQMNYSARSDTTKYTPNNFYYKKKYSCTQIRYVMVNHICTFPVAPTKMNRF